MMALRKKSAAMHRQLVGCMALASRRWGLKRGLWEMIFSELAGWMCGRDDSPRRDTGVNSNEQEQENNATTVRGREG
jgi:hypothetical protein